MAPALGSTAGSCLAPLTGPCLPVSVPNPAPRMITHAQAAPPMATTIPCRWCHPCTISQPDSQSTSQPSLSSSIHITGRGCIPASNQHACSITTRCNPICA